MSQLSANDIYNQRIERAKALLGEIEASLVQHQARQADHPRNWGYAGDVGHLVETLETAARFIRPR